MDYYLYDVDGVEEAVLQGVFNHQKGSMFFHSFSPFDYERIESAWKVMRRQPSVWFGESDGDNLTLAKILQIYPLGICRQSDLAHNQAVSDALTAKPQYGEMNKVKDIQDWLADHANHTVIMVGL